MKTEDEVLFDSESEISYVYVTFDPDYLRNYKFQTMSTSSHYSSFIEFNQHTKFRKILRHQNFLTPIIL